MPPGLPITEQVAQRIHEVIWNIRNSVAYVEADNGAFIDPNRIDVSVCREAIEAVSKVREFVVTDVLPYLEEKLRRLDP